jgi:hypothetical protein
MPNALRDHSRGRTHPATVRKDTAAHRPPTGRAVTACATTTGIRSCTALSEVPKAASETLKSLVKRGAKRVKPLMPTMGCATHPITVPVKLRVPSPAGEHKLRQLQGQFQHHQPTYVVARIVLAQPSGQASLSLHLS